MESEDGQYLALLEDLIDGLRISVQPFAVCDIGDDAMVDLERNARPTLHYVMHGSGSLAMPSLNLVVPLREHDIVLVPPGFTQHLVPSGAGAQTRPQQPTCRPIQEGFDRFSVGESPRRLLMVCAVADISHKSGERPFDRLQAPITAGAGIADSLGRLLDVMLEELARSGPASKDLAGSFLKLCLAHLLQGQAAAGDAKLPLLVALSDPRLARPIEMVLANPAGAYRLEALADAAGMSRSSFAEHFAQVVGMGPIAFLKGIRLGEAAQLLQDSDLPVKLIAAKVGYRSRSYFSRAFKAQFGQDPASYRVQRRGGAQTGT